MNNHRNDELSSRIDKVSMFMESMGDIRTREEYEAYRNNDIDTKRKILLKKQPEVEEKLLGEIICKVYIKALPLDEDFITNNCEELKCGMVKFLQSHGGASTYVAEAIKKNDSSLLKNMVNKSKTMAKDVYADKNSKLCEISISDLDYDITADDDEKLNNFTDDMELDEVSDIIRQNVKDTVVKEIERAKKEEEAEASLQEELNNNESLTSESAIDEYISKTRLGQPKQIQPSLFESIMIGSTKVMTESANMDDMLCQTICEYTKHSVIKALKIDTYYPKQVRELSYKYTK